MDYVLHKVFRPQCAERELSLHPLTPAHVELLFSKDRSIPLEMEVAMINCEIVWHPQVEFYQGPRSHSRMPSLVGDSGQVLGVLG